jgi:hypothetical protein
MTFLKQLLNGGSNHTATVSEDIVSVKPTGDLEAFQTTADEIIRHEGQGYSIFSMHICKDRPGDFTDLIVLRLED